MNDPLHINVSGYRSGFSLRNRLVRGIWACIWLVCFRCSPVFCFGWRRFLLRVFGSRIGKGASIYPSTRVWAPWNLEMGDYSCLSFGVDCYCVAKIIIGSHSTISQYAHLCTATHDIRDPVMGLISKPITIGAGVWVCAGAFLGPGVTMGEGAVAGARAVVMKDVEPWTVVAGNPARIIKRRELRIS